jgi:hypothetical protein
MSETTTSVARKRASTPADAARNAHRWHQAASAAPAQARAQNRVSVSLAGRRMRALCMDRPTRSARQTTEHPPTASGTQRTAGSGQSAGNAGGGAERTRRRLRPPHHSEKAGLLALALSLGCFGAAVGLRSRGASAGQSSAGVTVARDRTAPVAAAAAADQEGAIQRGVGVVNHGVWSAELCALLTSARTVGSSRSRVAVQAHRSSAVVEGSRRYFVPCRSLCAQ